VDESVNVLMAELRKVGVLSGGPTNPMGLPMPSGFDGYFLEVTPVEMMFLSV